MIIASLTYVNSPAFKKPQDWVRHVKPYFGILEELARTHTVHCFEQISFRGEYQEKGIHYHFFNFHTRINRVPLRFHRAVKKIKPDIVFVRGLHFPFQVLLLRRALGRQVKIFLQHHAGLPGRGWSRLWQRRADRQVDGYFFADADAASTWVNKGAIAQKEKIRATGLLSSVFSPMDPAAAKAVTGVSGLPVYCWVGALHPNKDPLTVVRGFLLYIRYAPQAKLYMIFHQAGQLESIKAILRNEGQYNDAIILVGPVRHEDLLYWYNSSDFIISGSHRESYGLAVCEAMSCGCIPLLTSIPSFQLLTADWSCGLAYKPGDENALLEVLLKSKSMDIASEKEKVLQQFRKELSFSAIATRLQNIIMPA